MHEPLDVTTITSQLNTRWLGRNIIYFPEIGSTNDWLKTELEQRPPEELPAGSLIITDYQNQGRGRLSRRWEAPRHSSLLLTLLFRPQWPGQQANWLAMMASLAAAEAVTAVTGLKIGIKWPNDLVIGRPPHWRKVGGLLLETAFDAQGLVITACLGLGLNVNLLPEELPPAVTPATSLSIESDQPVDRINLLLALLVKLEGYYDAAAHGRSPFPAWRARLVNVGQPVQVTDFLAGRTVRGLAVDVNDCGHLIVADDDGRHHTITAGDVTLRPLDISNHSQ